MARNVKELLENNVPYSEMTDEEITAMIEYRASVIVNSIEYKERAELANDYYMSNMLYSRKLADDSIKKTEELVNKLLSHGGDI